MNLDRLGRWRLPAVALGALALALAVVAVILLPSTLLAPDTSPTPTATVRASATAAPDTPEAAVRAFFKAFAEARRSDDPSLVLPFVTSDESDAYLSVSAFLAGQRDLGKASVITVQELNNLTVSSADSTATVEFDYVEGGYDIDLETGEPLESPAVLPSSHVTVSVQKVDSRWLVDSYTSRQ